MEAPEAETQDSNGKYTISERLASLDALRGFDMMFIMGGDSIGHALAHCKAAESGPMNMLAEQLDHVAWEGFRFYDLIFPLFVFMAGVSLVFALAKAEAKGGKSAAARRVIKRGVILYLIGIFYYGAWGNDLPGREGIEGIRLFGVLQRIAICYLCAGLLYLYLKPRGLLFTVMGLLVGYWALMSFVPMPGLDQVSFAEGKNLANWVDAKFVPFFKWDGPHDPEGLLSNLPAIATCLIGVFVGMFLRDDRKTGQQKVLWLAGIGVLLVLLGHLWGMQFPVIKKLWTSSYVLVAAGWSAILMAVFYGIIDVKGHSRWAQPFIWIGLNPITIYLLGNLMNFDEIAARVLGGPVKGVADGISHGLGDVVIACGGMGLAVFVCWWLHRRRIYLRV